MKVLLNFAVNYLISVLAVLYLFLFGFLSAKHRTLIIAICEHFGLRRKAIKPMLPQIDMKDIVRENDPIEIREPIGVDGNVSLLEVVVIAKLIRRHNPHCLFEIGTYDGRTTLNMACNSLRDSVIYTLDLPRTKIGETDLPIESADRLYIVKEESGRRFAQSDCLAKINQLFGDSASFDFTPFVNQIDFVFVDGSHSYEYVLSDSKWALKMLREGRGIILWHDYDQWRGVTRALDELHLTARGFEGIRHICGTSLAYLCNL